MLDLELVLIDMENFLLPDEIVLKIFGYLGLSELIQCAKVSRRFNMICKDNSLGYKSSMSIMKDLGVEDQKYINKILIARPELTKVEIHSITWEQLEEDDEKRLSKAMASRKFLGPKSYCLEKKKKVLKALGASVHVQFLLKNMDAGPLRTLMVDDYPTWFQLHNLGRRRPLEIGLAYYMPTLRSEIDKRIRHKKKRRVVDKQGRLKFI